MRCSHLGYNTTAARVTRMSSSRAAGIQHINKVLEAVVNVAPDAERTDTMLTITGHDGPANHNGVALVPLRRQQRCL